MPIIHPTYYPDSRCWRSHNTSAPTVSELLRKLGPAYACRDYYPIGREVPRETLPHGLSSADGTVRHSQLRQVRQYARTDPVQRSEPVGAPKPQVARKTPQRPPVVASSPVYQPGPDRTEAVLRLWSEAGFTQAEIALELGLRINAVAGILCRGRQRGDQRAALRRV